MSTLKAYHLTDKYEMKIEEVDAITGPLIGRPKTATFRLQDLVGLDTGDKVGAFVTANVDDEFFGPIKDTPRPDYLTFLLENKFLGNKTKKGFYERTKKRDEKGSRIIMALDLKTKEYAPSVKPRLAAVKEAKSIELFDKRMQTLMSGTEREHKFLQEYFASVFAYAANRVPEISDEYYSIDDAMRAGYMWEYGPFEHWDKLGLAAGIKLIEDHGHSLPTWIKDMQAAGHESFYKLEGGKKVYYSLASKSYVAVPGMESFIILDAHREKEPIIEKV